LFFFSVRWRALLPSKVVKSTRKVAQRVGQTLAGIAAVAFGVGVYGFVTLPDVRPLADTNPTTTAFIELRAEEARAEGKTPRQIQRWISYPRISPNLKRAVLVAEDAAFWQHDGIDYEELQKSIELDWARGQLVRGASTITQQLAKNLFLSPSRNPARKLRELVITRRLEAELPKSRILELYLNVIEWGDGIYGIEAASEHYFGYPASALTPSSAALLAGAIINPRVLNPSHPTGRLLRRQQMILKRMGAVTPPVEVARTAPATGATESAPEGSPENSAETSTETPVAPPVVAVPGLISSELPAPPPETDEVPHEPK
jgi:monofunctional biosynthetic peptidoglycan transglycosylase